MVSKEGKIDQMATFFSDSYVVCIDKTEKQIKKKLNFYLFYFM